MRALALRISLADFALLVLFQAGIVWLAARKWVLILRHLPGNGSALPQGDAVAATAIGTLAGQVLPIQIVTPLVRAWAVRRHNIPATRAIGTSLFEQVFEVVVLAAMAALSVLILSLNVAAAVAAGAALALAVLISILIRPGLRLAALILSWIGRHLLQRIMAPMAEAFSRAAEYPPQIIGIVTGLSFVRYFLLLGVSLLVIWRMSPETALISLALAYPLILLVVSLPFIPAGLGLVEVTWVGVLTTAGLPVAEAAAIAIVTRIMVSGSFVAAVPFLIAFRSRTQS